MWKDEETCEVSWMLSRISLEHEYCYLFSSPSLRVGIFDRRKHHYWDDTLRLLVLVPVFERWSDISRISAKPRCELFFQVRDRICVRVISERTPRTATFSWFKIHSIILGFNFVWISVRTRSEPRTRRWRITAKLFMAWRYWDPDPSFSRIIRTGQTLS